MTGRIPVQKCAHRVSARAFARAVARGSMTTALLLSLAAGSAIVASTGFAPPAFAQAAGVEEPAPQLLLQADQLVYDNDAEIVTAIGSVQLDYNGYQVVAQRVSYNQRTRQVKAFGNVEIVEPSGNRIFASEIDITDDFSVGFVNALRVDTPDNTSITAESAERFEGEKTVFNNGTYTACQACRDDPEHPPLWQIKAKKIILDGQAKTITYRHARFEFFGKPIAYLPYFRHADPSVKRKTGLIRPTYGYQEELGVWYRQPFFIKTGETHDFTLTGTGYSRQGFLLHGRWRQQLENGYYTLQAAGIKQQERSAFNSSPDIDSINRGMLATTGKFDINPRWAFGWDVLAQSDRNFSRTYQIPDFNKRVQTNTVYLRGLHDKSYFDLAGYQFRIQDDLLTDDNGFQTNENQALVRPSLDYNYVKTEDLTGGEVSLDVNVTSLERDEIDSFLSTPGGDVRTSGIDGESTRLSADLAWRKTLNSSFGLRVTPSFSLRGDWSHIDGTADPASEPVANGSESRFMATAGLEVSYPVLVRTANSSHVFEPIAQLFVRPDLENDSVLPNEDAQSLVFEASNLFARDKFSGYDRIESGTRVNAGLRYSGALSNGLSLSAIVGQSYSIAGENPYAREDDLTNTGEESGLEEARSDYVASFGASTFSGFTLNTNGRFDRNTFSFERGQVSAGFISDELTFDLSYAFIEAQPDSGFASDRHEIDFASRILLAENWSTFGSLVYNIEDDLFVSSSIGLSYHEESFTFSLAFREKQNTAGEEDRSIGFRVAFRTLGEFDAAVSGEVLESLQDFSDLDSSE
ncbi:MAG: LPS-assembly protein LptD [Pseudomonadota bacterium]